MISKTEISSWYDRMCFRTGWSAKISKRKWMIFQIVLGLLVMLALSFPIAHFSDHESRSDFLRVGLPIVLIVMVFCHKDWDRDQQKLRDKEETVTL